MGPTLGQFWLVRSNPTVCSREPEGLSGREQARNCCPPTRPRSSIRPFRPRFRLRRIGRLLPRQAMSGGTSAVP